MWDFGQGQIGQLSHIPPGATGIHIRNYCRAVDMAVPIDTPEQSIVGGDSVVKWSLGGVVVEDRCVCLRVLPLSVFLQFYFFLWLRSR